MHAGHLIIPNEVVCEVIPQGKCRFHILQHFSIDWEIRRYCVIDSPFLERRTD